MVALLKVTLHDKISVRKQELKTIHVTLQTFVASSKQGQDEFLHKNNMGLFPTTEPELLWQVQQHPASPQKSQLTLIILLLTLAKGLKSNFKIWNLLRFKS